MYADGEHQERKGADCVHVSTVQGEGRIQEFCFGHDKFRMPVRHPIGDEQAAGYVLQGIGEKPGWEI